MQHSSCVRTSVSVYVWMSKERCRCGKYALLRSEGFLHAAGTLGFTMVVLVCGLVVGEDKKKREAYVVVVAVVVWMVVRRKLVETETSVTTTADVKVTVTYWVAVLVSSVT